MEVRMTGLRLDALRDVVAGKVRPFFEEVLEGYGANMHSIHVVGSALTGDFDERTSDVNSIFVLKDMDLKFLEMLAPMGKKYRKSRVSAPLIMTPAYIESSRDVFSIEFLNFRLVHLSVYGEDILSPIRIEHADLRHQCEREIKVKLIGLRQGYISNLGDARAVTEALVSSITGYIPLFRGIIVLSGKEPPVLHADVLRTLKDATGVDCGVYEKVLREKREKVKLSKLEVDALFERYYAATEKLGKVIDEIKV
jgi:hypothetical protein